MSLRRSACGGIFCPHTSLTECFSIFLAFYFNLFQVEMQ